MNLWRFPFPVGLVTRIYDVISIQGPDAGRTEFTAGA